MSPTLAEDFDKAMVQVYVRALREAKYKASWYLDMLMARGGLQTAKDLLKTREDVQSGLVKLWDLGRLDLSVENLVLQPEWQSDRPAILVAARAPTLMHSRPLQPRYRYCRF